MILATVDDRRVPADSQGSLGPDRRTFNRAVEIVRDGFITPDHLTSLPGKISGCVYRADGSKVALSERFADYFGDHAQNDIPIVLTSRCQPER